MAFFVDRRIWDALSSCGRKVTPCWRIGRGRGGINFVIEMKKDHAHNGAMAGGTSQFAEGPWKPAGKRSAEGGGESRRNAPAPRVERTPWVFVKAREHLPPVWQLLSPPPYFSYRSFFALQIVRADFTSLCPLPFSRLVAGHTRVMKSLLMHVLHFGGWVQRRVGDLCNRTHILGTLGTHMCVCLEIVYWSQSCTFCLLEQDLFLPHESWREICPPTISMFTLKKIPIQTIQKE